MGDFVIKRYVHLDTHWPSCQFYSWLGRWCTWNYIIWRVRSTGLFVIKTSKRQFGLIDVCSMFMPQSCLCFCKCHSYSDEYQVISLGFLLGSWGALSDMWTITTPCVFGTWCWWWWYDSRRQSPFSRSIWWRMLKLDASIDWLILRYFCTEMQMCVSFIIQMVNR